MSAETKDIKPLMGVDGEILLERNYNTPGPDVNDFDAIMHCVSLIDKVEKLQYKNYTYYVNTLDAIEVSKNIFFLSESLQHDKDTGRPLKAVIRLYSTNDTKIAQIKEWIAKCRQDYEAYKTNKLGSEVYYFDHTVANDRNFDSAPSFDKKKYETYRTFENIFFEEKNAVVGRVNHFLTNKQWFHKKGIPHTLGFMFHGPPGCGKTSAIKAIANASRRHIVNVRLSEIKTNKQLKNLFYNPDLQVVNPQTLVVEKFTVPIHQRLYVIEDIDAMTDLVKRRDLKLPHEDTINKRIDALESKTRAVLDARAVAKPRKTAPKPVVMDADEELEAWRQQTREQEEVEMKTEVISSQSLLNDNDKITLDSLLNILDGTFEIQNRMFCITTNHKDIIDPALIRPGRVDMIIEFKLASVRIIREMFESFHDTHKFTDRDFAGMKDYVVSPADVNQILFKHLSQPVLALDELRKLTL